jgi:hypothetical protein
VQAGDINAPIATTNRTEFGLSRLESTLLRGIFTGAISLTLATVPVLFLLSILDNGLAPHFMWLIPATLLGFLFTALLFLAFSAFRQRPTWKQAALSVVIAAAGIGSFLLIVIGLVFFVDI